jgi:hypothetical protein
LDDPEEVDQELHTIERGAGADMGLTNDLLLVIGRSLAGIWRELRLLREAGTTQDDEA